MSNAPRAEPAFARLRALTPAFVRRPAFVQAVAIVLAAAFAYNGARILNDSSPSLAPALDNFDVSLPWLGGALLALAVSAWAAPPPRLSIRGWPSRIASYAREHRVELLVLAGIVAFGVFMRIYRFGDTLPPANGLCCEEQINGGAAYGALQGQRPLNFLITRWGAAAGFAVFGETTFGLRFFFLVMSIATLVLFYLLLRELVSRPVALFGVALYAAAWWPSLRARQPTEGTIYAVLFALVLVRGLKTKHPLWFLCAGVLAALLSYEYEPFKAVPIIVFAFLVAAAAREVALRRPFTFGGARERARALFVLAWRPALIAFLAIGVVLVPMVVGTHRGYDLYLTSVHRQESDRGGNRIADEWAKQLKWGAEIFLPVGPNDYPASAPREFPGNDAFDPLAGWLAIAGLVAGAALSFRGVRGLFVLWIALSIVGGALLLHDFAAWKFIVLVPAFLALAALLLDDARALVVRRWGEQGARVFAGLLVAGAAFSFWWNADTLFNDIAPSASVAESYGGEGALIYETCHDLHERGSSNYAVVASDSAKFAALNAPGDTYGKQARAWGDFIWVCHDLHGMALPAPEEAWPLRDAPQGPLTVALAKTEGRPDDVIAGLQRVYPTLGAPTKRVVGPAGTYTYTAWNFADRSALYTPGLWAQYVAADGSRVPGRVDPVNDLAWTDEPPPIAPPFNVHWTGLIYLGASGTVGLQAIADDPVVVRLDGQVDYDTSSEQRPRTFVDLVAGWHVVDIALDKQEGGGAVRLAWVTPDGAEQPVAPDDLFPLEQISGWVQQRSVGVPGDLQQQVTQRLDFAPHYVLTAPIEASAPEDATVTQERWRGVWQVEQDGDYTLRAEFQSGTVTLLIDGAPAATADARLQRQVDANVTLAPGRHTIELVQDLPTRTDRAGLTFSAFRRMAGAAPEPVTLAVTPY